jgi:putative phage-type endonuclease
MKRSKFIGGSDVAAILGLNRYKTPYEVWDEKKNGNNSFTGNPATEWGNKLEPAIIKHFEQVNNTQVFDNNITYLSDKYNFIGCHPDGIFFKGSEKLLLEVKTVSSTAYKHWANELPLEYFCQVQHNLYVTGLKKAKFVCLVLDDRNYFEIDVNFDEVFCEQQTAYLIEWWERYIVGDETPIKVVADYEKASPETAMVQAEKEDLITYQNLVEIKAKIKALETEKETLEDKIKLRIGEASELVDGLTTLATWKASTTVRVETKKLKEELPETFLKYAKETTSRKLLIKL